MPANPKIATADSCQALEILTAVQSKVELVTEAVTPEVADTSLTADAAILPMAMQDHELSERDVETLRKIAEDKSAATGRLRRVPKKIPTAEPAGKD